jgi:hypothetical protein
MSYPPRLIIELEYEQPGRIVLHAATLEDERRLRFWLRRASAMEALPEIAARLLDDLDEFDQRFAA